MVLPGAARNEIISMFAKHGAKNASTIKEAELVVFTGGTDVNPELYGQKQTRHTPVVDITRDKEEQKVFEACKEWDVPMLGICRGAQFLHVMNGGKLWQHVTGHCGSHDIVDIEKDVLVRATSTHHQMCKTNKEIELIACTNVPISMRFIDDKQDIVYDVTKTSIIEVEAGYYDKTKTLIIQGHPEYDRGGPFEYWCMDLIFDRLNKIYGND